MYRLALIMLFGGTVEGQLMDSGLICPGFHTATKKNLSDENDENNGNELTSIATLYDCADECAAKNTCEAFEYNAGAQRCTLKETNHYEISGTQASGWISCRQNAERPCPSDFRVISENLSDENDDNGNELTSRSTIDNCA